jgi:hypothetical protein
MAYGTKIGEWEIRSMNSLILHTYHMQGGKRAPFEVGGLYNFNMFGSQGHKILPLDYPSKLEVSNPFNWEIMA